jgi:hypothetical protein
LKITKKNKNKKNIVSSKIWPILESIGQGLSLRSLKKYPRMVWVVIWNSIEEKLRKIVNLVKIRELKEPRVSLKQMTKLKVN